MTDTYAEMYAGSTLEGTIPNGVGELSFAARVNPDGKTGDIRLYVNDALRSTVAIGSTAKGFSYTARNIKAGGNVKVRFESTLGTAASIRIDNIVWENYGGAVSAYRPVKGANRVNVSAVSRSVRYDLGGKTLAPGTSHRGVSVVVSSGVSGSRIVPIVSTGAGTTR
jgi:hypothetical protein